MRWLILALALTGLVGAAAEAADLPHNFIEEVVVTGLDQPVSMRFLPDGRILVAEQRSRQIRLIQDGAVHATDPVLTVPNVNIQGGERGLLSLEVDDQWPARNFVYAYYTYISGPNRAVRVTRYTASGDLDGSGDGSLTLAANSALHILPNMPDVASNHNGGDLRFGPDGMLYVSVGDDEMTRCQAQDPTSYVGKILRLQVDQLSAVATGDVAIPDINPGDNPFPGQGAVANLVYTVGLRNPFRFHVDPADGSLFIADVGNNRWEEVSHVEAPGINLGWPYREGFADTAGDNGIDLSLCPNEPQGFNPVPPIAVLANASPSSIVASPVYRRIAKRATLPSGYEGDIFYTDFYHGQLVRLTGSGQSWTIQSAPGQPAPGRWADNLDAPIDFAVSAAGDLHYVSISGSIVRFVYTGPATAETRSMGSLKAGFDSGEEQ